jgi:uncharacterized protein (DUF1330 family)
MAAYLIVEHRITDPAKFEDYRSKVGPLITKHGGRYLTKGGTHKVLETCVYRKLNPDVLVMESAEDRA